MFRYEMKYAMRRLVRSPLFTCTAIVTLGLGIGANTAVFSVVRNVLIEPLPYEDPDRLVMLWEQNLERGWEFFTVSPANFVDWREQTESFVDLSAISTYRVTLTGHGDPERLFVADVSSSFFSIFGTLPEHGRVFTQDENEPGRGNVTVLSHGLWQRLYGADPAAVGQSIDLNGVGYEIVGVMPASMSYPSDVQLWLPLVFDFEVAGSRGAHYLRVLGRMTQTASLTSAAAEMNTLAGSLALEYPDTNRGWGARVDGFRDLLVGRSVTRTLYVLWAAVGFVLLIACVNLANLFLARTSAQRAEFALRAALGAGKRRLIRQMFSESLFVGFMGLTLGVGLAWVAVRTLIALDPTNLPRLHEVQLDATVLTVSVALTAAVVLIAALVPVLHGTRTGLFSAFRDAASVNGPVGAERLRSFLVVVQVAVAVMVVIGSGLVLRSLWRLQSVDPGFRVDGVALFDVSPPSDRYADYPQLRVFHDNVLRDLTMLPGVTAAAVTNLVPLDGDLRFSFMPVDADLAPPDRPSGLMRTVTPRYFETIGIPIISGRGFSETDRADHPVVIINQSLAEGYFQDRNPVGQQLVVGYGASQCPCEIIGVVGDVRQRGFSVEPGPGYYLPYAQTGWRSVSVLARTSEDPEALLVAMRGVVTRYDADLAIDNLETLADRVAGTIAQPRFNAVLLVTFGAVSMLLAVIGVYGIMAYTVSARVPEIGVCMALGASASRVAARVVGQGLVITGVGVMLGAVGALAVTRFLAVMLFEIQPFDPITVGSVMVLVTLCGVLSSYLPARRASHIDPVVALKTDV